MISSTYDNLEKKIAIEIGDTRNGLNHFRDEILRVDAEKEIYDKPIFNLDTELLGRITVVNDSIDAVGDAFQERINVGCRTDMFWRVVGFDTTTDPHEYDVRVTKMQRSRYDPITAQASITVNDSVTIIDKVGLTTITNQYGFIDHNLFGLKYYEEPFNKDIGDTTVAKFIGTVSAGSTELVMMIPETNKLQDSFELGQLITCSQGGVFANPSYKIAGIGSTTADLTVLTGSDRNSGIGSTIVTVPLILLDTNTVGFVTAPTKEGTFITFTVLDDPAGIGTISDFEIKFTANPFSPQTIGILTNPGTGKSVFIDNSGHPSGPEDWRPEMEVSGVEDVVDVSEPLVGAGKSSYHVGFTSAPIQPGGARASEGQTFTGLTLSDIQTSYISNLSACSSEETALTNAISERDNLEATFNSGISTTNLLLNATNDIRKERDEFSIRIWSNRQLIGEQTRLENRRVTLRNVIGINTIREIIDNDNE
jgi:hypothetical protein